MLPEEQNALHQVLSQAAQVPTQLPDPQAEQMIRQSLGARPDALYLLTQMLAYKEMQLRQAQQAVFQLQQHLQQVQAQQAAQAPRSFFGFGRPAAPVMQPPVMQPPMMQPQPGYSPFGAPSGGSFLGNVATTAAGVVAGEAAFGAISSLFGGGHHAASGGGGGFPTSAPSETVINNYYGDSSDEEDADDDDNY